MATIRSRQRIGIIALASLIVLGIVGLRAHAVWRTATQILNLTYDSTRGAVQMVTVGRGVTAPQNPTNFLTTDQIYNLTYNASKGALQVYLDESSFDFAAPETVITTATHQIAAANRKDMYLCTYAGAVTITLQTDLLTLAKGRMITIIDAAGQASIATPLTIDTQGAELINGANTYTLPGAYHAVRLYNTGTAWLVAGEKGINWVGASLLSNGSFTSNVTGWTGSGGTIASVAGGVSGNACELTYVSGSTQSFYQSITTVPGRQYQIVFWVKSGTSGNENAYATASEANSSGPIMSFAYAKSSTTWTMGASVFTAVSTSTRILLYKATATAGTMLFDEVAVYEVN